MAEKKTGIRIINDEAVRAKTGKGWEDWFAILDRWVQKRGGTPKAQSIYASTMGSVLGGFKPLPFAMNGKGD